MQVHCISISEHIWVGGCGPRGVGELPAGGIRASQGTFSSFDNFLFTDFDTVYIDHVYITSCPCYNESANPSVISSHIPDVRCNGSCKLGIKI